MVGAALAGDGCIKVDSHQRTSVPGLYAAGDVVHRPRPDQPRHGRRRRRRDDHPQRPGREAAALARSHPGNAGSRKRQLSCIAFIIHHLLNLGAGGIFMRFLALAALSVSLAACGSPGPQIAQAGPSIEAKLAATWPTAAPPRQAAFSRDGRLVALSDASGAITIRSTHSWKILRTLVHAGGATTVAFTQDGTALVSGGYDGAIRVWDLGTGRQTGVIKASSRHDLDSRFVAGRHAFGRGRRRQDHSHLGPANAGFADAIARPQPQYLGSALQPGRRDALPAAASTQACDCGTQRRGAS